MPKKGAIELSLGFIVAVIFAVVLLSVAIMWLNGVINNANALTSSMFEQAQLKLQETFSTTEKTFAVWPDSQRLKRGDELWVAAGINNNANDALNHNFVINVISVSTGAGWLDWDKQPGLIQINNVGYKKIVIKVPNDAPSGSYLFNVVACKDVASYSECTSQNLNWGGAAQPLTIIVQ
jgi:uncharacterized membrane protein